MEANDKDSQKGIEEKIIEMIRETKFGSIEVTVHDSKIVQLEKKEKTRF